MAIDIKRALISPYDKTGLPDLVSYLESRGVQIVSTGGTSRFLNELGIDHHRVEEVTGFPEILDGRVKTLHPVIHAGILADRCSELHSSQLQDYSIEPFDLVVVNFYPFEEVIRRGCGEKDAIENIDIGGPTMVRAAAKNHACVCVVVDPADYPRSMQTVGSENNPRPAVRGRMALTAFTRTASYDAAIVETFSKMWNHDTFPEHEVLHLRHVNRLRYGENAHQEAALYKLGNMETGFADLRQLQGKELSFNNLIDMDAAWRCANSFEGVTAVIVKHTNPCGIGTGDTIEQAFERAWACDPKSAFGGIIALTRACTEELAERIRKYFVEVVIAPDFEAGARTILSKKKKLRLIAMPPLGKPSGFDLKRIWGGFLLQTWDQGDPETTEGNVVTRRSHGEEEKKALAFAWKAVMHVKSTAIVSGDAHLTVGMGAVPSRRVDSVGRVVG